MSLNHPSFLHAMCGISADGATVRYAFGATPAKSAKGVYTLTLDRGADSTQVAFAICPIAAAAGNEFTITHTSDTVKTLSFFDNAGAAIDTEFTACVFSTPKS